MADDLDKLARDLTESARRIGAGTGKAVKDSSEQVRDDWRSSVRSRPGSRLRHFPASITYEVRTGTRGGAWVEGVIGPDKKKRQGPLGNIVEFGSSLHGPVAPARDAVVDRVEPRFTEAVFDLTKDVL